MASGKDLSASAGDARDVGLIPGLGRSPGGGNGNLFQYSCLENPTDRSLVGHSLWDHKELDMTEHARMQNVVRRAHDLCGILAPDP